MVSPSTSAFLRIPLVRGRNFSDAEAKAEAAVAVVSETGRAEVVAGPRTPWGAP